MRKPRFSLAVFLVMLVVLVTGTVQAKDKITFWCINGENDPYGKVLTALKPMLKERFPDLDVEIVYGATTPKFTVAIVGGAAPDIMILPTRGAGYFVEKKLVSPIDREVFGVKSNDDLKKLFYGGSIGSMYMNGDVYFIPTEVTTLGTYANLDIMANAGLTSTIPDTWEGLAAVAKKTVRRKPDQTIEVGGIALNRGYVWPMLNWTGIVRQAGTDWQVNGVPQFSNAKVSEYLQFYQDLYTTTAIAAKNHNSGTFFKGQDAFFIGGSYNLNNMYDPKQVNFAWNTAGYPHFKDAPRSSTSYSWGMYVYSGSKHQKEAWEVIEALTDGKNAPLWYQISKLLIPRNGSWIIKAIGDDQRKVNFINEYDYAKMEIAHPNFDPINSAINAAEVELVDKGAPIRGVLEQLDQKVKLAMEAPLK